MSPVDDDMPQTTSSPEPDPFSDLISKCNNSPAEIQHAYSTHRANRNAQQSLLFLSPSFPGVTPEHYLSLTEFSPTGKDPSGQALDPRNSLVLWGRPPEHVLKLASAIQAKLRLAAPRQSPSASFSLPLLTLKDKKDLWLMPLQRMHITVVEIAFSKTPEEIARLLAPLRPHVSTLVNYTYSHRSRLVKPLVSYDATGIALTFLPAAGEARASPDPSCPSNLEDIEERGDAYTYHHLRQDAYNLVKKFSPTPPEPRYQLPSAHITLGRYLTRDDHGTQEQREAWVAAVNEVNRWLEEEVWSGRSEFIGEWAVGQEKGLEMRAGTVWYGGGRTIMAGEGF